MVCAARYGSYYQIYCHHFDGNTWIGPESVSPTYAHEYPRIRRGPAPGNIMHTTYRRDTDNPSRIRYSYHDGAGWSGYQDVYEYSGSYLSEPDLGIDASDNVHVVWTRYSDSRTYYSTNASGSWLSSPVALNSGTASRPQVAAYSEDNVHVVWCDNNQNIYYKRYDGISWSAIPDKIDIGPSDARYPYMRKGQDGRIHLVYYEYDGSYWQIWYTSR
jgi:hypothetical protein